MATLGDLAWGEVFCFFALWRLDGILRWMGFRCESQRWFVLHAIANVVVAGCAAPDLIDCVRDHTYSQMPAASVVPACLAFGLHAYHCLAFRLRSEDWLHHVVYVFATAPLVCMHNTKAMQVCFFFCTGAPGAADYTLLALAKSDRVSRDRRRQLYGYSSACVRLPGGVFGGSLLIQDSLKSAGRGPTCGLLGCMMMANAIYYGHQAARQAGRAEALAGENKVV
jgi:hypothetical protein